MHSCMTAVRGDRDRICLLLFTRVFASVLFVILGAEQQTRHTRGKQIERRITSLYA